MRGAANEPLDLTWAVSRLFVVSFLPSAPLLTWVVQLRGVGSMWLPLYDELTHNALRLMGRPVLCDHRRPTALDLDRFEAERGLKLPRSYRNYAVIFGPGLLARYFDIAVPGCRERAKRYDLALLDANSPSHYPVDLSEEIHPGDSAQIRRMLFFCETVGAESIGWDTTELTDKTEQEYEIYLLPRIGELVRIANSFPEFINDIGWGVNCQLTSRLRQRNGVGRTGECLRHCEVRGASNQVPQQHVHATHAHSGFNVPPA